MKENKKGIYLRLDGSLIKNVKLFAITEEMTITSVIEKSITNFLEKGRDQWKTILEKKRRAIRD